ncbi:MAG: hypothetical protein WBV22_12270, partial [Anaerolineaceae bacterium]
THIRINVKISLSVLFMDYIYCGVKYKKTFMLFTLLLDVGLMLVLATPVVAIAEETPDLDGHPYIE